MKRKLHDKLSQALKTKKSDILRYVKKQKEIADLLSETISNLNPNERLQAAQWLFGGLYEALAAFEKAVFRTQTFLPLVGVNFFEKPKPARVTKQSEGGSK